MKREQPSMAEIQISLLPHPCTTAVSALSQYFSVSALTLYYSAQHFLTVQQFPTMCTETGVSLCLGLGVVCLLICAVWSFQSLGKGKISVTQGFAPWGLVVWKYCFVSCQYYTKPQVVLKKSFCFFCALAYFRNLL